MGEPMYDPVHDVRHVAPVLPDQEQRFRRDEHGLGPTRRTRAWIVAAVGVALVAIFVAMLALGGGDAEPGPDNNVVVQSPP